MTIGIDARPLQGETKYRGIGKTLEFFLGALINELDDETTCVFYADKDLPLPEILKTYKSSKIIYVAHSKLGKTKYIRSVLPAYRPIKPSRKDIDVFLQYDATLGVPTSVPTVTIFYDLIPLLFRVAEKAQKTKGLRRVKNTLAGEMYWRKYLKFLKEYKKSKHIIAISESSLRDLKKHIPSIKHIKSTAIHLGMNPIYDQSPINKSTKLLADKPYVLYVGGVDIRKNIIGLLDSFYKLKIKHPDLRLIAAGKEFSIKNALDDLGWSKLLDSRPDYAKDVIAPGYLKGNDLHYLYKNAAVFVFPSRYEGFGLPILEAMQAGCPVIAYDNSSIPEVAGDAAILVKDGSSLVPAIDSILNSKKLHDQLAVKGYEQAKKFTWQENARQTLKIVKEVAGR